MAKKLIRLTESDLHRIVKESVHRMLTESNLSNTMGLTWQDIAEITRMYERCKAEREESGIDDEDGYPAHLSRDSIAKEVLEQFIQFRGIEGYPSWHDNDWNDYEDYDDIGGEDWKMPANEYETNPYNAKDMGEYNFMTKTKDINNDVNARVAQNKHNQRNTNYGSSKVLAHDYNTPEGRAALERDTNAEKSTYKF